MTKLLVRDIDPEVAQALKRRAAKHGRSTSRDSQAGLAWT